MNARHRPDPQTTRPPGATASVADSIFGLAVLALLLLVPRGWFELLDVLGGPTRRLVRSLGRRLDYRRYLNSGTW